jgi:hypothetical protein
VGEVESNIQGLNSTVRNPGALDRLNRELAELEKRAQAVNTVFRKFDSGAQDLLERPDRQAGAPKS